MKRNKLNEKDNELLFFCYNTKRTMGEIARELMITPTSVTEKVRKLESRGYLDVERRGLGKKAFVKTKEGQSYDEKCLKELLSLIKDNPNIEENGLVYLLKLKGHNTQLIESLVYGCKLNFLTITTQKISPKGEERLNQINKILKKEDIK